MVGGAPLCAEIVGDPVFTPPSFPTGQKNYVLYLNNDLLEADAPWYVLVTNESQACIKCPLKKIILIFNNLQITKKYYIVQQQYLHKIRFYCTDSQ